MILSAVLEERLRSWLEPGSRLLMALSGGPDSVAVAHALRSSPYSLVLGHVDHRLRPESAEDARFVRRLARQWDLPCQVVHANVLQRARSRRQGVEEAARNIRYEALAKMARQAHCAGIVTAHTADDQAETVLMNLLRGTGPLGLAGIPPVRNLGTDLVVYRPALGISRRQILRYLRQNGLTYREDATNREQRFTRNRLRHTTFPYLERRYPGLQRHLVQLGEILREEEGFWGDQVQKRFEKTVRQNNGTATVDLNRLLGYHRALGRRILRRLLGGLSFQELERVFDWIRSPRAEPSTHTVEGLLMVRKGQELRVCPR